MRGPFKMLLIGVGWDGARPAISVAWWNSFIQNFRIITVPFCANYFWLGRGFMRSPQ